MQQPTNTLIAIGGGIGSGKSIVAKMLRAMGHLVYDSDLRARAIMNTNEPMKRAICQAMGRNILTPDGLIDRLQLSDIVFSDPSKLNSLNAIVHSAVCDDIKQWRQHNSTRATLWVESAIIYESGIDKLVDAVWLVSAPESLRIERVMTRNDLTADQVIKRIEAQSHTATYATHPRQAIIVNDGVTPLLPQIEALLSHTT